MCAFYHKTTVSILLTGMVFASFSFAGGAKASSVHMYCRSTNTILTNAINAYRENYNGAEGTYSQLFSFPFSNQKTSYYARVYYTDVKPYALSFSHFMNNKNYNRNAASASNTDSAWFGLSKDEKSASFNEAKLHQFAEMTNSKNSAVLDTHPGTITITYRRADGTTQQKTINVVVQRRECEAYQSGIWREVSPGRWEQQ
jgi:hypothetical protein